MWRTVVMLCAGLLGAVPLYAHAGPVAARPILAPPAHEPLQAAFQACNQRFDGRLSYAFLPSTARSAGFDRLEAVTLTSADLNSDARERRWINTLNTVYAPDEGPQFSVQYGGRLIERNDAAGGSNYADLLSLEVQHEFATGWKVASHIGARHSWDADAVDYSAGASVGVRLLHNVWIAARYNPLGFNDPDFSGTAYSAKGFFLKMRIVLDEVRSSDSNSDIARLRW